MKTNTQRNNWILDAVLFIGFLVSYLVDMTGLALHEWLGVAVGVLAVYHLVVHWQWVKTVTRRLFGHTSGEARWFYVMDVGLTVGFLAILVSGLIISTWLDLPLQNYLVWRDAHIVASIATLMLTVTKIGYHWKWIVCVAKRSIIKPLVAVLTPDTAQPSPGAALAGRRDFLRLMSVVGIAALLASYRSVETVLATHLSDWGPTPVPEPSTAMTLPTATATVSAEATATASVIPPTALAPAVAATPTGASLSQTIPEASATASPAVTSLPTATVIPASTIAVNVSAATATASPCVVRCSKGCSFPGQCRKYTDANQNGRCDLGECL